MDVDADLIDDELKTILNEANCKKEENSMTTEFLDSQFQTIANIDTTIPMASVRKIGSLKYF